MAQSLETLRNTMHPSIFGRRLGINVDDFMVGPKDLVKAIEDLTTGSTGTDILNYGVAAVTGLGSSQGPTQVSLAAPQPGVSKTLVMACTSTGSYQFLSTPNGASILAGSDGTTKSLVNLLGQGGAVVLMGLTTAMWAVVSDPGKSSATLNVSYTTST